MGAELTEDPRMAALAQAIAESRPRAAAASSVKAAAPFKASPRRPTRRWLAVSLSVLALGAAGAGATVYLKRSGPGAQVAATTAPRKPTGIVMGPLADMPEIRDGVVALAPAPKPAAAAPPAIAAAPPPVLAAAPPIAPPPATPPVRVVPLGPPDAPSNTPPQLAPSPVIPPRVTSASLAGNGGASVLATATVSRPPEPAPVTPEPPPAGAAARAEPGPLLRPTDTSGSRAATEPPPRPSIVRPRPEIASVSSEPPTRRPERVSANRPRTADTSRAAPVAPRPGPAPNPAAPPPTAAEPDERLEVLGVKLPNGRDIQDGVRSIGQAVIDLPRRIIPGG